MACQALGADEVMLRDLDATTNIAPNIRQLPVHYRVESPQQALAYWRDGEFLAGGFTTYITTELSDNSQWLAFQLRRSANDNVEREWVLSTQDVMHLTRLSLYVPVQQDGQATYRLQRDSLHDMDGPPLGTSMSSFLLSPDFDDSRPFFLRVDGTLPLSAPLVLQTTQAANWESAVRIALSSLLFGSVLGLLFYNFVLYFFVRDATYLLYVAYAVSMLLWLMQISGYMLFLDRDLGLRYYSLISPNFSAGLANVLGSLFTVVFLRLHQQNRWQGVMVMLVSGINLCVGIATYFIVDKSTYALLHTAQYAIAGLSALVVVVPTILLALQGYRFALPFILAWGSLGAGIILMAAGVKPVYFGVSFPIGFNVLSAMAVEMVLMSYALGLRIKDVHSEADEMAQRSITDGLTELYNQRYFHDKTRTVVQMQSVHGSDWACAMMDIDHFKSFNDRYGHLLGDKVLKQLGQIIRTNIRQQDFGFRAGGEEFALLLNTDSLDEALKIVERIRCSFEAAVIVSDTGESLQCSLSAGVAQLRRHDGSDSFIHRADQALYSAKHAGRNRTLVAPALAT